MRLITGKNWPAPAKALAVIILVAALLWPVFGQRVVSVEKPALVATTTMIQSMVQLLAGDELKVMVLIPPGACPGHFDLKPGDALLISQAGLVIRHDYQAYLDNKLESQNAKLSIEALTDVGHLLVPENYLAATGQVKEILMRHFPLLGPAMEANYEAACRNIPETGALARRRIDEAHLRGAKVLCSVMQEGFLRWIGCQVCGSFTNSPEELSVQGLKNLLQTASVCGVDLVVSNFQGGGEAIAREAADDLGVPLCVISNFTATNERNKTYSGLLMDNITLLGRAYPGRAHP